MKTVIVGAGFGGLKAAIELSKRKTGEVVLVSSDDVFLMHATLYSTATGRDKAESAIPLSKILSNYPEVKFVKDTISQVDGLSKTVKGSKKSYKYDKLILSLGSTDYFSSANSRKKYSFGLNSLQSAEDFQRNFHEMLVTEHQKDIRLVIVGAGMVGVELAGALSEYVERIRQAHRISELNVDLMLLEKSSRILPGTSRTASHRIAQRLKNYGVNIKLRQNISRISKSSMIIDGKKMDYDMMIWATGGGNNPIFAKHKDMFKLAKNGKVVVNQCMEAYPDIYVIGDNADTPYSGSATTAISDAMFVAKALDKQANGKRVVSSRKVEAPILSVPLTRFWAYVEYGGVYMSGFFGAMARRLIELNLYCHFLPLKDAWSVWRKHRKANNFCTLCAKSDFN